MLYKTNDMPEIFFTYRGQLLDKIDVINYKETYSYKKNAWKINISIFERALDLEGFLLKNNIDLYVKKKVCKDNQIQCVRWYYFPSAALNKLKEEVRQDALFLCKMNFESVERRGINEQDLPADIQNYLKTNKNA